MRTGHLFPPESLTKLEKWSQICDQLATNNLIARPLRIDDYQNGYLELLSQLTLVGPVSREKFERKFTQMKRINELDQHYLIVVIEDTKTHRVVATSTLFTEHKFIHECGKRGRLEDVAVLDSHRSKRIGLTLVGLIVELAREFGCYKITLDCTDQLKSFYIKNNFTYNCNMMSIKFADFNHE